MSVPWQADPAELAYEPALTDEQQTLSRLIFMRLYRAERVHGGNHW